MATYEDVDRALGADQFDPDLTLRFTGIQPFDGESAAIAARLSEDILDGLVRDFNVGEKLPWHGNDVEVPEVPWVEVEKSIMSTLSNINTADVFRMFAYWAGKWNTAAANHVVIFSRSGHGMPMETYALLGRCCANELFSRIEANREEEVPYDS